MKKLLLTLIASLALLAPAIAGQNEKFTGNTQIQSGSLVIKRGVAVSIETDASVTGLVRKFSLGAPAIISTGSVVEAVAIKTTTSTYTVALPTLDVPRNVRVTRALTSTVDTGSTSVIVVGTDYNGAALTETIAIPATATTTEGTKAFKTITSITQSGTNTAVDGADTVAVGVGKLIGLPISLNSANSHLLGLIGGSVGAFPATNGTLATSTVEANTTSAYDGSKKLVVFLDK